MKYFRVCTFSVNYITFMLLCRDIRRNSTGLTDFCRQFLARNGGIGRSFRNHLEKVCDVTKQVTTKTIKLHLKKFKDAKFCLW